MEKIVTIDGQPFQIGQKVYIFREEILYYKHKEFIKHTAAFKSEISEINKRIFKVKGLNKDWDRFHYEIIDNKVIPSVNGIKQDKFSFWNRDTYVLEVVNEETHQLYLQTKKENPGSMRKKIDDFINQEKIRFSNMKTKDLLEKRREYYLGHWGSFSNILFSMLKEELSKREHIPNRQEKKILRRKASRG